ncbi:MAG: MltA domain-containing protein [Thiothrix sp.]|uniref:MltA domain-containing protein n=1 Tax=Thiothrix sp. TaxID=1032 RepID=UPI002628F909|nr:MltA domain-containing protein [Thiothrix sp.]MDD5393102.1 MltA domain-containing protein [Thiothrix sp.]
MSRHCSVAAVLVCVTTSLPLSASANAPAWESWGQPYQQPRRVYAPPRPVNPVYQQASYASYSPDSAALDCGFAQALNLPDQCIRKNERTRQGLLGLTNYLKRLPLAAQVAPLWGRVSNAALLETVNELLAWHDGLAPGTLQDRFFLRELSSAGRAAEAEYTGYFTPLLSVHEHPDGEYRIPIYRKPAGGLASLSHAEIASRALSGRNLEVAWTNDAVNLFFAQVQGSGVARFPDGSEMVLEYAGDNGKRFRSIADYMRQQGFRPRNYGNEAIREWLRENPSKIGEVLTANPRYVFFKLTSGLPTTSSGLQVIPGHTIAVDSNYIPLGAVLLAEVPRIDADGQNVGQDWRLLFAQDQGGDIKGAGRLDLYTGFGQPAENLAHGITGFRKAYMLVRRPGYGRGENVAGM